jgi:hypothetical protein
LFRSESCYISKGFIIENRVQWFRCEAQFEHWKEEIEIKHAELHRGITYFGMMKEVWEAVGSKNGSLAANAPGHTAKNEYLGAKAYALRTAGMYQRLKKRMAEVLRDTGIELLKDIPKGKRLVDQVYAWRELEIREHFLYCGYR